MSRFIDRAIEQWNRIPMRVKLAGLGVLGIVIAAVVVALVVTSQSSFYAQYDALGTSYKTLQTSTHADLDCDACHVDRRPAPINAAGRVADFYTVLVASPDEPSYMDVGAVDSDACKSCHDQDWSDDISRTSKIPHPAHLRVSSEKRDCVECHKWTAHEEAYMKKHESMPFSTVCASFGCHVGSKQKDECQTCHHTLQDSKGSWKEIHPQTVRASGPNGCLEACHDADQCRLCHTTGKRPEFSGNVAQTGMKAIEREHVKKDWLEKHGDLALDDESKCMACHVSLGECQDCHSKRPAFHGPKSTWLNRHVKFAENEKRCLACHKKDWCEECHKQFKEMR